MKQLFIPLAVVVSLSASTEAALCQTPPSSPAVFGGAAQEEQQGGLDALVELFQAYDDNVLAGQGGGSPTQPVAETASGMYSGVGVAAQYNRLGDGANFRSWVNSAVRYYPDFKDLFAASHQVGVNLSHPLSRRVTLQIGSVGFYSPRYSMRLFPDSDSDRETVASDQTISAGSDIDFAVVRGTYFRYAGDTSLTFILSNLSNVSVRYGISKTEFDDLPEDLEVQTAGIRFIHRFTKNASLRLGYLRQEGNYVTTDRQLVENLTLGVDYSKPLSRSRRTVVHFSSGSVAAEDGNGRRFQATGSATLAHHIGRTWIARVDYNRGMRHIEGFDRPIFSDSASMTLGGLATRRIETYLSGAYFTGTVGLRGNAPRFESYAAFARMRTAVTKTLAAYLEYRFYHYRFDAAADRPLGVPRAFDRNGARIGLSLFVPLIK